MSVSFLEILFEYSSKIQPVVENFENNIIRPIAMKVTYLSELLLGADLIN